MKQDTPIQMFLSEMQHHVETIDQSLSPNNQYLIGYKQCLLNHIKLVNDILLEDEKELIVNAYEAALNIKDPLFYDITTGLEYYSTIYNTINIDK